MAPSEFLRVEHNINGKLISDPVEFNNLLYSGDGHISTSKDKPAQSDSKKHRKRPSRHRNKTNKQQPPKQSYIDNKALQDAIDRDHRRMGFEPMQRKHDHN